jgi:hypothetical protein
LNTTNLNCSAALGRSKSSAKRWIRGQFYRAEKAKESIEVEVYFRSGEDEQAEGET